MEFSSCMALVTPHRHSACSRVIFTITGTM
jgi:hypothetical protein